MVINKIDNSMDYDEIVKSLEQEYNGSCISLLSLPTFFHDEFFYWLQDIIMVDDTRKMIFYILCHDENGYLCIKTVVFVEGHRITITICKKGRNELGKSYIGACINTKVPSSNTYRTVEISNRLYCKESFYGVLFSIINYLIKKF